MIYALLLNLALSGSILFLLIRRKQMTEIELINDARRFVESCASSVRNAIDAMPEALDKVIEAARQGDGAAQQARAAAIQQIIESARPLLAMADEIGFKIDDAVTKAGQPADPAAHSDDSGGTSKPDGGGGG